MNRISTQLNKRGRVLSPDINYDERSPSVNDSTFLIVSNTSDNFQYLNNNATSFTNTINPNLLGASEICLTKLIVPLDLDVIGADSPENFLINSTMFIYMDNISRTHVGNSMSSVLNIQPIDVWTSNIFSHEFRDASINWVTVTNSIDFITVVIQNLNGDPHPYIKKEGDTYLVLKCR